MPESIYSLEMLHKLPQMSFRGITLPCVDREFEFGHERIPHHFVYRDGVTTEMMGIEGKVFNYTLPMRESIAVGGLKYLFSKVIFELQTAFENPDPGPLVDPRIGTVMVTPGVWREKTDPHKTDGVDVSLSFFEYTAIGTKSEDSPPTITGVYDSARALDAEVARTPWTVQQPSPQPTTDPLSAIAGVLEQVNATRERADAMVMSVSNRANDVEMAAEKLGLAGEPARRAARKLRLDCERTANAPPRDKAGVLVGIAVDSPKTIAQMAAENNMTIAELIRSNTGLARSPIIPAGSRVYVRKS